MKKFNQEVINFEIAKGQSLCGRTFEGQAVVLKEAFSDISNNPHFY